MEKNSYEKTSEKFHNLLEELKHINTSYEYHLNLMGKEIINVEADGNCLFRAFSYHLFKNENLYDHIR